MSTPGFILPRVHHQHEEHAVKIYRDVNIDGTLHLAGCAVSAGVRQFTFVSTVLIHGRTSRFWSLP